MASTVVEDVVVSVLVVAVEPEHDQRFASVFVHFYAADIEIPFPKTQQHAASGWKQ